MKRRDVLRLGLAGSATLALGPGLSRAQGRFPERPIRLVLPYVAGGPTDLVARKYAQKLGLLAGQPVVVESRPGADGAIGAAEVARAAPDGHTLLFGTSSISIITPALMEKPTYDPGKDFAHLAVLGTQSLALVVSSELPVKDLRDLVGQIRANPGKFSFAGASSVARLTALLFARQAGGLDMIDIPYKGSGQALQDFLANRVHLYPAAIGSVLNLHRAGKARILAVCAEKRVRILPEVPTAIEAGVPDMIISTFNVLSAPAATPQPVVDQIAQYNVKIAADEAFAQDLEAAGIEALIDASPSRTTRQINEAAVRLAPVIRSIRGKGS